jgi:hypothetical protein
VGLLMDGAWSFLCCHDVPHGATTPSVNPASRALLSGPATWLDDRGRSEKAADGVIYGGDDGVNAARLVTEPPDLLQFRRPGMAKDASPSTVSSTLIMCFVC